jgi:hypothetical protein
MELLPSGFCSYLLGFKKLHSCCSWSQCPVWFTGDSSYFCRVQQLSNKKLPRSERQCFFSMCVLRACMLLSFFLYLSPQFLNILSHAVTQKHNKDGRVKKYSSSVFIYVSRREKRIMMINECTLLWQDIEVKGTQRCAGKGAEDGWRRPLFHCHT